MAFAFIDNQPIRFNSAKFDDQPCINKDLSAYNILMQPGDPLHWQAKLRCCDANEACDPFTEGAELVTDGDMSNAAAFTLTAGWAIAAGVATYTAPGAGSITQPIAMIVGRPYIVRVQVNSNNTGFPLDVYLGGRRIGNIAAGLTGSFMLYGAAGLTGGNITVLSSPDYAQASTGTAVIDNLSVKSLAACYTFDTSTNEYVVNGTFTGSATGWTLNSGWAYNVNNVIHSTGTNDFYQALQNLMNRRTYQISINVGGAVGSITMQFGSGNNGYLAIQTLAAGTGTTTINYTSYTLLGTTLSILPTNTFDGTIDTISIQETASGWTLHPENGFCHEAGWANAFYAGNTLTVGRYYKMTVEVIVNNTDTQSLSQTLSEKSVTIEAGGVVLGVVDKSGVYTYYFTAITTEGERFTPTTYFDGCILPTIDICFLFRDTLQARLVYSDGVTGATDWHDVNSSSNPLILDGDWVTWRVISLAAVLSGGSPIALPYSCFMVQVKLVCDVLDPPSVTTTTSDTVINYKETHDCTKLFMAYSEGDALDFNFGYQGNMFRLYSRLRTLYFNPSYPIDAQDYEFSSGISQRIYATKKKKYELLFDYMDEYAHDVIALMIVCDTMIIDNVQYIADAKDYEPEWAERGKRNLAQSIIELQKSDGILFNRNCS